MPQQWHKPRGKTIDAKPITAVVVAKSEEKTSLLQLQLWQVSYRWMRCLRLIHVITISATRGYCNREASPLYLQLSHIKETHVTEVGRNLLYRHKSMVSSGNSTAFLINRCHQMYVCARVWGMYMCITTAFLWDLKIVPSLLCRRSLCLSVYVGTSLLLKNLWLEVGYIKSSEELKKVLTLCKSIWNLKARSLRSKCWVSSA